MSHKSDKDCAQTLVAAAMAAPHDDNARQTLVQQQLSDSEMARGAAYIASGQDVRGRAS